MRATDILRVNLVRKRAELDISQSALAARADVSRATVSKVEQGDGNITVAKLERIATVLGCRLDELFRSRFLRANAAALKRRAKAPDSEFISARVLGDAIDEAMGVRYSNAGRPRSR